MEQEIWKPVKGFESQYLVSNFGRVKMIATEIGNGKKGNHVIKEHFVTVHKEYGDRPQVRFAFDNKMHRRYLANVVADAFIPNPNDISGIVHINGDVNDCRVSNLSRSDDAITSIVGEIWKDVQGYEGLYMISNYGRIKSCQRTIISSSGKTLTLRPRIKTPSIGVGGYPVVNLCKEGKSRTYRLHRLIAIAFIENPDNKPFIDHINRDVTDYRIENLRWCTQKENMCNPLSVDYSREFVDKKALSKRANDTKKKKGTMTAPRTVYQYSLDGSLLNKFYSIKEAARTLCIHSTGINQVLDKGKYTYKGYYWTTSLKDK